MPGFKSSVGGVRRQLFLFLLAGTMAILSTLSAYGADRKVLIRVKPDYPPIAKRLKIAGSVLLSVVVLPSGHVKAANFVMGEKILLEAAQTAVEKWKFEPSDEQTIEDVELNFPHDSVDPK